MKKIDSLAPAMILKYLQKWQSSRRDLALYKTFSKFLFSQVTHYDEFHMQDPPKQPASTMEDGSMRVM